MILKTIAEKCNRSSKYQSCFSSSLCTKPRTIFSDSPLLSHGRITSSQGSATRQWTTTVDKSKCYGAGKSNSTPKPPCATNQQHIMRIQQSARQPRNRSGFLCMACGFADFAQFWLGLPLAVKSRSNLGWIRVLPCFVLPCYVIFVQSVGVYLPHRCIMPIWCPEFS